MEAIVKTHNNTVEAAPAASTTQAQINKENVSGDSTTKANAIALPIVISQWQKNSREILRVRLDAYKGQTVIDCRAWYGEPDNLKAGRGGLTLSVKHLPALAAALETALKQAYTNGLLQEGGDD